MPGRLAIVGLGPGADGMQIPEATRALAEASDLIGYAPYLARVPGRTGQRRHASGNGDELARARLGLQLAAKGSRVAVVSSGDPGVFAMASTVFEAMEDGEAEWREVPVEVIPGISAMFAAAARIGAPLGHDFCAISLSDNLKPWATVLRRLEAAAAAGFVIALYNPISHARPWQLASAFSRLQTILSPATPVVFARAISRPEERVETTTLAKADAGRADMSTVVLIGSAATRRMARPEGGEWIYTPRFAPKESE